MTIYRFFLVLIACVFCQASRSGAAVSLNENTLKVLNLPHPRPKWIAIDFWASWCGPCEASAPFYEKQAKKWKDQSVYFVGMNQDDDPAAQQKWLKEHSISFPQIFDKDHNVAHQLDVDTLPRLLIFDHDGKLVKMVRGFHGKEFSDDLEKDFAVLFGSKNNKKESSTGSNK